MKKGTIILLIGISGSGKNYYLTNKFLKDFPQVNDILTEFNIELNELIVEPDAMRLELTGTIQTGVNEVVIWKTVPLRLKDKLSKYGIVILNGINLIARDRKSTLKNFINYTKVAIVLEPNPELSKERIKNDIDSNVVRANVSPEIIDRQMISFSKFVVNNVNWDGIWNKPTKKKITEHLRNEFDEIKFVD